MYQLRYPYGESKEMRTLTIITRYNGKPLTEVELGKFSLLKRIGLAVGIIIHKQIYFDAINLTRKD